LGFSVEISAAKALQDDEVSALSKGVKVLRTSEALAKAETTL
jgi:hypothetical protein